MLEGIKRYFRQMFGNAEEVAETVVSVEKPAPGPTDTCAVVKSGGYAKLWPVCGHVSDEYFCLDWYGEIEEPTQRMLDAHGLCGKCLLEKLKAASCRCAGCGLVILAGQPVALYADSERFRPEWKTRVGKKSVIGCLRKNCCPSEGFFSGHWAPSGFTTKFMDR